MENFSSRKGSAVEELPMKSLLSKNKIPYGIIGIENAIS
jgi:hypothetical protein